MQRRISNICTWRKCGAVDYKDVFNLNQKAFSGLRKVTKYKFSILNIIFKHIAQNTYCINAYIKFKVEEKNNLKGDKEIFLPFEIIFKYNG